MSKPAGGSVGGVKSGAVGGIEGGIKEVSCEGTKSLKVSFEGHLGVKGDDGGVDGRARVKHIPTCLEPRKQLKPSDPRQG